MTLYQNTGTQLGMLGLASEDNGSNRKRRLAAEASVSDQIEQT
jgi:hypothetical protein